MKRNSVLVGPKKPSEPEKGKKHSFSNHLNSDPRVAVAPRHVDLIYPPKGENKGSYAYIVKIYAALDTPGSELMTISCVDKRTDREFEMRFDERFPISMRFKKLTDQERVGYAKEQIERAGGFERLIEAFQAVFGHISA